MGYGPPGGPPGVPKAIGGRCCLPPITLCEGNWVILKGRRRKGERREGGREKRKKRSSGSCNGKRESIDHCVL